MSKRKIVVGIMCLLLGASSVLASCSQSADTKNPTNEKDIRYVTEYSMEYPQKSLEELVANSALIVKASQVETLPAKKRNERVVTDRVFRISQVYSGDKTVGDKITVQTLGGIFGDTQYVASGEKSVQNGEEVILILSYPTDENDKIISTEYYVYFPPAGIYYKDGEKFVANDESFQLDPATVQMRIDAIRAETVSQ